MATYRFNRVYFICVGLFFIVVASLASAQTLSQFVTLDQASGSLVENLVQARDGTFYAVAQAGGAGAYCPMNYGCGTIFTIGPDGTQTVLHNFCSQPNCADGGIPFNLVLATDGNLYGALYSTNGQNENPGGIFKLAPDGTYTLLYSFAENGVHGQNPTGGLVEAADGNLYGTTSGAGSNGSGTVFRLTFSGDLTTLYVFPDCPVACRNGTGPVTTLALGDDGNLYGSTSTGGLPQCVFELGCGTVFQITTSGALTTLHGFSQRDGIYPQTPVEGRDGAIYGSAVNGGVSCPDAPGCGTLYKVTKDGKFTPTFQFEGFDGAYPGPLTLGSDGNFYGVTVNGGKWGVGVVFSTPNGAHPKNLPFNHVNGEHPSTYCPLLQATDGNFYGYDGAIFRASYGLDPFVAFVVGVGYPGQNVQILGRGFTGTTEVTFNGRPTEYKVESDTFLVARAPEGVTTGFVTVTTPSGTLTSNQPFAVIQ